MPPARRPPATTIPLKPAGPVRLSAVRNGRRFVFQLIACNLACLAIAALYYGWRDVYMHRRKRARLHDRVAYMLWVAANRPA